MLLLLRLLGMLLLLLLLLCLLGMLLLLLLLLLCLLLSVLLLLLRELNGLLSALLLRLVGRGLRLGRRGDEDLEGSLDTGQRLGVEISNDGLLASGTIELKLQVLVHVHLSRLQNLALLLGLLFSLGHALLSSLLLEALCRCTTHGLERHGLLGEARQQVRRSLGIPESGELLGLLKEFLVETTSVLLGGLTQFLHGDGLLRLSRLLSNHVVILSLH